MECLDRSRQENLDLTARLAEWWVRALEEHHLEVLRQDEVARRRALVSRLKYRSDSRISYVDCTIAALIERHGVRELLSGDPHFRLLCPGARLLPEDDEAGRG